MDFLEESHSQFLSWWDSGFLMWDVCAFFHTADGPSRFFVAVVFFLVGVCLTLVCGCAWYCLCMLCEMFLDLRVSSWVS